MKPPADRSLAAPTPRGDRAVVRKERPRVSDARVREYTEAASSRATRDAYQADWRAFVVWCERGGVAPLPCAETEVARYIAGMADCGMAVASIERAVTAIARAHVLVGHPGMRKAPHVHEAILGARRKLGTAQDAKAPLSLAELRAMVALIGGSGLRETMERALLLVAWWGAMRRSEVAALAVDDVEFLDAGLRVRVRRSKTDQTGEGAFIGLPAKDDPAICPVLALRTWLDTAGHKEGALFRAVVAGKIREGIDHEGRCIARLVKRHAKSLGIDPARVAGHSLRAGFITEAKTQGGDPLEIMQTSRHKSVAMLKKYIRPDDVFTINAAKRMK